MSKLESASLWISIIIGSLTILFFIIVLSIFILSKFYILLANRYIKNYNSKINITDCYKNMFFNHYIKKNQDTIPLIKQENISTKKYDKKFEIFHAWYNFKETKNDIRKHINEKIGENYVLFSNNWWKMENDKKIIINKFKKIKKIYFQNFEIIQKSYFSSLYLLSMYYSSIDHKIKLNKIKELKFKFTENINIYEDKFVLFDFGNNCDNSILFDGRNGEFSFKNSINEQIRDIDEDSASYKEIQFIKKSIEKINNLISKSLLNKDDFFIDIFNGEENIKIYEIFKIKFFFSNPKILNRKYELSNMDGITNKRFYTILIKSHYEYFIKKEILSMNINEICKNKIRYLFSKKELNKIKKWSFKMEENFKNNY